MSTHIAMIDPIYTQQQSKGKNKKQNQSINQTVPDNAISFLSALKNVHTVDCTVYRRTKEQDCNNPQIFRVLFLSC